mmetsp:Transcript_41766/g.138476  ORF Transcript_41766/g.138476 Transcript_41766/m.138476 type:complete len:504 (+) Transcript_41766:140-1651(+)
MASLKAVRSQLACLDTPPHTALCAKTLKPAAHLTSARFSLGQEETDALLTVVDEISGARARTRKFLEVTALEQRRPPRSAILPALPLGPKLAARERHIKQGDLLRAVGRHQPGEVHKRHIRKLRRGTTQIADRRQLELCRRPSPTERGWRLARAECRRETEGERAVRGAAKRADEARQVELSHCRRVVALVRASWPPRPGRKVADRRCRVGARHDDRRMADAEARALRVVVGEALHRADELARHLRDHRHAAEQRRRRDQVVHDCMQAAEAQAASAGRRPSGELLRLLSKRRERGNVGIGQRQRARLRRERRAARREAGLVQPAVPKAVRAEPKEAPRFGPAGVREALPHVCDVHVGQRVARRLWHARPLRLGVVAERGEPRGCDQHPAGRRRARQQQPEWDPVLLAFPHRRARSRGRVRRRAEREPEERRLEARLEEAARVRRLVRRTKRRRALVLELAPRHKLLRVLSSAHNHALVPEGRPQVRLPAVAGGPREDPPPQLE